MQAVQEIINVFVASVVSLAVLFILTRLGGKRQIAQMNLFDYVNSITIGSIAAEMATNLEQWYRPLTAMIVYGIAAFAVHYGTCKNRNVRLWLSGQAIPLMENGTIYKAELDRAKIDLNEFLAQARVAGYFDLNEVQCAMLETSGQISFLPKSFNRPVTPQDLAIQTDPASKWYDLVLDGKLIEEITAKYLFQTLQIEKIELGEAVSGEGNMTVDLQDTYMQNAKILLVSGENIEDFHVAGQCESLNMLQGNKFAVAELENPLERQITMDYSLENRGNVHTYLIKEYFLKADMEKSYTSEEGTFTLKVYVVNHQEKPVLDSETLKDSISVLINGKEASYRVENGTAMVPYQTDETAKVNVEIAIQSSGNVVHYIKTADTVELTVPVVEEEPDYTVLWIVIISLCAVVLLLSVLYERKKQKKNDGETGSIIIEKSEPPVLPKYDFSGQLAVYLLKGEQEDDVAPCSIKLFGKSRKSISFDWIKDRCGIDYKLSDADKIRFTGGKDHALCFKNSGYATIVKENQILKRERKYSLYYGEKILLIFNNGGTEIELHYKNMKPSER